MKSNKSKLMHILEGKVSSVSPTSVDACVVDGMFIYNTVIRKYSTHLGHHGKSL